MPLPSIFESGGCAFDPRRGRLAPRALQRMSDLLPDDKLLFMLLERLERIPADSPWAHRASGVRGALIRLLEQIEMGSSMDPAALKSNASMGFYILNEAAKARS